MKPKKYLGDHLEDSVYVQNDGFGLIITTSNGVRVTNEIYLSPQVYQNLVNYMNECVKLTMTEDFDQEDEILP